MGTSTASGASAATSDPARVDLPAAGAPVIPSNRRSPGTIRVRARSTSVPANLADISPPYAEVWTCRIR